MFDGLLVLVHKLESAAAEKCRIRAERTPRADLFRELSWRRDQAVIGGVKVEGVYFVPFKRDDVVTCAVHNVDSLQCTGDAHSTRLVTIFDMSSIHLDIPAITEIDDFHGPSTQSHDAINEIATPVTRVRAVWWWLIGEVHRMGQGSVDNSDVAIFQGWRKGDWVIRLVFRCERRNCVPDGLGVTRDCTTLAFLFLRPWLQRRFALCWAGDTRSFRCLTLLARYNVVGFAVAVGACLS